MRMATALALISLLLSGAAGSQEPSPQNNGHFDDWPNGLDSAVLWGEDRQTFEAMHLVRLVRPREALFSVAQNGFGWRPAFSDSDFNFKPWRDVTAWCSTPGLLFYRSRVDATGTGLANLNPEDLAIIVDEYFRKYSLDAELSDELECSPTAFRRQSPADMQKIVELLEAASAETP